MESVYCLNSSISLAVVDIRISLVWIADCDIVVILECPRIVNSLK